MSRAEKTLRVVFIDDVPQNIEMWGRSLKKAAPKGLLNILPGKSPEENKKEVQNAVKQLYQLRKESRERRPKATKSRTNAVDLFDNADIVIVDYDLLDLDEGNVVTGEEVAYLLRCYSKCGIIILLNPPDLGRNFFDLGLRRTMRSWADLSLGDLHLGNKWLWQDKPTGFSPWLWPNLPNAVERRRKQIKELTNNLKINILQLFNFPEEAIFSMDPEMAGIVSVSPKSSKDKTTSHTAPLFCTAEEIALKEGSGVHIKDMAGISVDTEQVARIAASRISIWLENIVLPAQNVLVDAPHLVNRLPGLLSGAFKKLESWTRTATRDTAITHKAVRAAEIEKYSFSSSLWLSRPAWYWPAIVSDPRYLEWANVSGKIDFVFCEDTTTFRPRSVAHEFVANVPPQFARRHVEIVEGDISYTPSVRLSL